MQYVFYASLFTFFPERDISDMSIAVSGIINGLDIAESIRLSKVLEPFLMRCHMVRGTGVDEPYIFWIGVISRSTG
mgnify:CR=1 FL=1